MVPETNVQLNPAHAKGKAPGRKPDASHASFTSIVEENLCDGFGDGNQQNDK